MQEVKLYEKVGDKLKCRLCPHGCLLKPQQTGICLARKNSGEKIVSLNYGKITSLALDPIEKKPFKRFMPGSVILSAGSFGCNFKCEFCQNYEISQQEADFRILSPQQLADIALSMVKDGNIGIAFTYNEPLIWYEFVYDCSKINKEQGLKNVLVTNGYINKEPMEALLPFIDAMNIDLKSFEPKFYRDICKGSLAPVMSTIEMCAKSCHVEVTTLIIPGYNDSDEQIASLSEWLAALSPELPLHLTAYHPDYRMEIPPQTSRERLYELADVAKTSLHYVYCGNC